MDEVKGATTNTHLTMKDDQVQTRLKNAVKGRATINDVFKKHDKSGDGALDAKELKQLIRKDLKLGAKDASDKDIAALVAALDDDGGGELDIAEIADFVRRGTETFVDPPRETRYLSRLLAPPA